ncbi:hypothetical protein RM780_26425 [Streptomyces sp. DSM 44917]|uniref:Uncharacterized protein n=1 Tax=Streptomyces boetiae TaxID=3075541 RepID=A0ABU2LFU3_9ACTN|nr:hypothetical protein [Streptomyces sp. DSM 44917]MDT0310457.1 hypothetical protein [Streptomyces sp. DSM 44917]
MVDPLSLGAVSAAVTAAASSVGTEAGRASWASLASLVRRAFGRDSEEAAGDTDEAAGGRILPLDPADPGQAEELTALIFGRIYQDEEFAEAYREWRRSSEAVVGTGGVQVNNTVGGHAQVQQLVQGQNITWHAS